MRLDSTFLLSFCAFLLGLTFGSWYTPRTMVPAQEKLPDAAYLTTNSCILDEHEPADITMFRTTQHGLWDNTILNSSLDWRVDPWVLKSMLWVESRARPHAINPDSGAAGISQFTAGGRRAIENLRARRGVPGRFTRAHALNPECAIPAAAELLRYMIDRCGGTVEQGLRGYNVGTCGGTSAYAREVVAYSQELREHTRPLRTEP